MLCGVVLVVCLCVTCNTSCTQDLYVSTEYLNPGDRVIIIDDFLAGGRTADALIRLCRMANANVVGAGFLIEKVRSIYLSIMYIDVCIIYMYIDI